MPILKAIIDRLGGPVKVAGLLKVHRTVPYSWLSGRRAPALEHRLELLKLADATTDERLQLLSIVQDRAA